MSRLNLIFDDLYSKFLPEFPDYSIREDGKIFRSVTRKSVTFHERNGYLYTHLMKIVNGEKKRTSIAQHQILALAFIPNPDKLLIVRHKNGDGLDNNIDNLEWSTRKEISQKRYESETTPKGGRPVIQYTLDRQFVNRFESIKEASDETSCSANLIIEVCIGKRESTKKFIWRYETEKDPFADEEGEEWKELSNLEDYKISSNGRIYSMKTTRYMTHQKRKDGYIRVRLGGSNYYVHKLVTRTFYGSPPDSLLFPVVNHKDGDKSNNTVENLEWIEFNDNILHAHTTGLNSTSKPVIRYSLTGVQISKYKSCVEAAKDAGICSVSISSACNKRKHVNTMAGSIWRFESDPLSLKELDNIKSLKSAVTQYTLDCKKIQEFPSIREAHKEVGIDETSISHACAGRFKTAGGFIWRRQGEPPPTEKARNGSKRKVEQLTLQGEHVRFWDSVSTAAKELRTQTSHISSVCKGDRKSTGGYSWKHVE